MCATSLTSTDAQKFKAAYEEAQAINKVALQKGSTDLSSEEVDRQMQKLSVQEEKKEEKKEEEKKEEKKEETKA